MSFEFNEPEEKKKGTAGSGKAAKASVLDEKPSEALHLLEGGSPDYTDDELETIFDALMFENSYMEELKIGKRLTVTLKTRSGKDARVVMEKLDKAGYALGLTVESIRSLYNLVQSAVAVNGKDISGETFEKKMDLIEDLPTPVISAMMISLVKFDRKIEAAVRHGEENF